MGDNMPTKNTKQLNLDKSEITHPKGKYHKIILKVTKKTYIHTFRARRYNRNRQQGFV